jgi:hypothetical protein
MMFSVRVVRHQQISMLNICDADLLGQDLDQDGLRISISRSYYGQRLVDAEEAGRLLRESAVINIAGRESVRLSTGLGIGSLNGVKTVKDVPFLIVFKM